MPRRLGLLLGLVLGLPVRGRAELPRVVVFPAAVDPRFARLPALTFHAANANEQSALRLYDGAGGLSHVALSGLSHLCRDFRAGAEVPMAPRTLQLVYKAALHFEAARVDIVSGYRASRGRRETSHHARGEAIDFRLPGVATRDLAEYVRRFGRVGVGYYPRVDFVHLDVRDASFFWVNRSRAGRHGWDRPLPRRQAVHVEDGWTPEWDLPWFDPPIAAVDSRARADFVPRSQRRRSRQR